MRLSTANAHIASHLRFEAPVADEDAIWHLHIQVQVDDYGLRSVGIQVRGHNVAGDGLRIFRRDTAVVQAVRMADVAASAR